MFHREDNSAEMDQAKADSLKGHVMGLGLTIKDLAISFAEGQATVSGVTGSQADREKIVLTVGNTYGVAGVDDQLTVEVSEPVATFYTVKSGDTLGGIAKTHYGNAMKYPGLFLVSRPVVPGLRIESPAHLS